MDDSREWFKKALKKIYGFDYGHQEKKNGHGYGIVAQGHHNYAPYTHH
jgi:hypothetical protein